MATIGDIRTGLATATSEAERALMQLSAAAILVDKAIATLEALSAGTRQPACRGAIGKLTGARNRFDQGAERVKAAIDQLRRYDAAL
ncbi:hypothetical protein [Plantactinospora sp. GCM10030261]|uniref:hypothetical protein n=1 Tax=Plantactinospora sp. GCM10030261 TaxID=3273420 RepID=UPI0036173C70